jgi:hypothetical protein
VPRVQMRRGLLRGLVGPIGGDGGKQHIAFGGEPRIRAAQHDSRLLRTRSDFFAAARRVRMNVVGANARKPRIAQSPRKVKPGFAETDKSEVQFVAHPVLHLLNQRIHPIAIVPPLIPY